MSFIIRCILREAKFCQNLAAQHQRTYKRWTAPALRTLQRRKERMPEQPKPKRSTFLEWNYGAELYAFANRLGEKFDESLLRQAMVLAEYVRQQESEEASLDLPTTQIQHNEQLAREGKIMASQYVLSFLRHELPSLPEEGIRALHDHVMSESVLANVSFHIGTKDLILTPDVEPSSEALATTLCAVIGALARGNPEGANQLIHDLLISQLSETSIADLWAPENPWVALEQILTRDKRVAPEARLVGESGVGTLLAAYYIAVFSDKVMLGKGFGESVNEAKEMAALDALRRMFGTTDTMIPVMSKPAPTVDQLHKASKPNLTLDLWSNNIVQN